MSQSLRAAAGIRAPGRVKSSLISDLHNDETSLDLETGAEVQLFNGISQTLGGNKSKQTLNVPQQARQEEDTSLELPKEHIQAIADDVSEQIALEVDFASILAYHRKEKVELIAEESQLVHGLVENLNEIVHKNSEVIDTIDSAVTKVNADVKNAFDKLTKANEHVRDQRQQACCLTLCLSFAVIVFVLFLTLVVRT